MTALETRLDELGRRLDALVARTRQTHGQPEVARQQLACLEEQSESLRGDLEALALLGDSALGNMTKVIEQALDGLERATERALNPSADAPPKGKRIVVNGAGRRKRSG
jgi:hypothetical protein